MNRGLVTVVCSLSMVWGCGSSSSSNTGGSGGGGAVDAAATGGSVGSTGGAGGAATGGVGGAATGGAGGAATGGSGGSAGAPADGGASDGPMSMGMMTSAKITAAAGGTLSSGGATLLVPAGALSADKELTLSVGAPAADLPGRDTVSGNVYDFGPSGTTFTVPVALTLPLAGAVPAGKKAVVAWLDPASAQWFPVPSTVDGDKVRGLVSHFTSFALLLLPDTALCPSAPGCGGSLDGTWKYTNSCLKATESEAAKCGDAGSITMRSEYQVGGTVTIANGRFDATQVITANGTLFYPPACIAAIRAGGIPDADCAKLQEAWRKQNPAAQWVCLGTVEQGCSCLLTQTLMNKAVGAVVITGQQVAFNEDGKAPDMPSDYCVKGSSLTVHDSDGSVYTAVKQ